MILPVEEMTPAEMMDLLEKNANPWLNANEVDAAYQKMVRDFTSNRRGND